MPAITNHPVVEFPADRLKAVWLLRDEHWRVRGPGLHHLFADRLDARTFARRLARRLRLPVRVEDAA